MFIYKKGISYLKKRDLEKKFKQGGWWLKRHGGNHDVWTNGRKEEQIPRHPEVNERLAKGILKRNGLE